MTFMENYGRTDCSGDCKGDSDVDGDVDLDDLEVFAAGFGKIDCPVSPNEIIVDNGDDGTLNTGWWTNSVNGDRYGPTHSYSYWDSATYTWTAFLKGTYKVAMWWRAYQDWCSAVPVKIYDRFNLLDTVYVDQSKDGGQWNPLGFGPYNFTDQARIVVSLPYSDCGIDADAVKFVH
jgi:hypothetical protein